MSGNYDYPPASRRPSRGGHPTDRFQRPSPTRVQHLRDLLSSERRNRNNTTAARALETLDQEIEESRSDNDPAPPSFEQIRAELDRQIQRLQSDLSGRDDRIRNLLRDHQDYAIVNPPEMNQEPSRPPDMPRPMNRPFRRRAMRDRTARGRRPIRVTENNTLLDEPVPHLDSPTVMPQSADSDRQSNRRRVKRRKLESDDIREGPRSFSYGQYGQVVPGMLRMDLTSCDGGMFEPDGESSFPENILRNDSSVYCTKSDRCNLILEHVGGFPFCLKRIVIKAPKTGYDSPIQEGMVFVSMVHDDLLTRTADDQVYYSGARRRRRNRRGLFPSEEYLGYRATPTWQRTLDSSSDTHPTSDNSGIHAPGPIAGFRVTTTFDDSEPPDDYELDDDDDDDNDADAEANQAPTTTEVERLQMEQMEDEMACSDTDESASDSTSDLNNPEFDAIYRVNPARRLRAFREQWRREHQHESSFIEPPSINTAPPPPPPQQQHPSSGSASSSDAQLHPQNHGLLRPHAQFFIERKQSMVNIKFDPPPSGRYILIKLWSPHNGGNIDIQSVVAHGFAGPRFFPAMGFR